MCRLTNLLLTFLLMLLLSGCKVNVHSDLYVTDVFSDKNLRTPAQMSIEITSCDSENRKKLEASILSLFDSASQAKVAGCEEKGMNSMLKVTFKAEVASKESSADLILFRRPASDDKMTAVGIKPTFSDSFISRVETFMSDQMGRLDYSDLNISFVVDNDDRDEVFYTVYYAWVNGEPVEDARRQPLARRDQVNVVLSNVVSDLVLQAKQPTVVWIGRYK